MTSFREKTQELIEKAEHCEWNLECDEKLLELMQHVAKVNVPKVNRDFPPLQLI